MVNVLRVKLCETWMCQMTLETSKIDTQTTIYVNTAHVDFFIS